MSEPVHTVSSLTDMSIDEKILYVQDLWDTIASTPDDIRVTPAQRAELRRRLGLHRADPSQSRSWEEVRAEIERRRS